MAGNGKTVEQSVTEVIKGVTKKTAVLAAVAAIGALVLQTLLWPGLPAWSLPGGVIFGAMLGAVNFRWLARAVERVYLRTGLAAPAASIAAAVITVLKLSAIFVILYFVIKWDVFNIFGLVAGLTTCFAAILWQGITVMAGGTEKRG